LDIDNIYKTMKDFETRKKEFLERYEALTKELQCDVASAPQYFAIGGGAFATTLVKEVIDLSKMGTPSPFVDAK
jgi:hypothetical protein